jgi:hypothetical protein
MLLKDRLGPEADIGKDWVEGNADRTDEPNL